MADYRVGEEVLAPWLQDGFLYPAVLVLVAGGTGHIAYFDGAEADVPLATLRHGAFGPGLGVSVNWRGRGTYYFGTVMARTGMALDIAYASGERGWCTMAQCRIPAAVAALLAPSYIVCSYCGVAVTSTTCESCGAPRPGRR